MNEILAFIRAQLDTDEQIAHAARQSMVGGNWDAKHHPRTMSSVMDRGAIVAKEVDEEAAEHIARHDPGRVIAEVQAHRAILNRHGLETDERDGTPPFHYCLTCGSGEPHEYPTRWPCATLLDLVSIYADRDGYRAEWSA